LPENRFGIGEAGKDKSGESTCGREKRVLPDEAAMDCWRPLDLEEGLEIEKKGKKEKFNRNLLGIK